MAVPPWVQPIETKPAPMPLLRVQAFVNTWESDTGVDQLATWTGLGPVDLAEARQVREAIRALLVANGGGPAPTAADLAPLRQLAAGHRLDLAVAADGAVRVAASGLADLLVVIRDAQADGSWARLKACHNDDCRWAFFDRSHSQRGRWCDMAVCGNRIKNRNYRRR